MDPMTATTATRDPAAGAGWSRADEMQAARRVQSRLLRGTDFRPDGLECAGLCLQERGVGGDFYDLIQAAPGRVALVLGDVSGKGVPAALMMATLQAGLRSHYALASGGLGRRLESVNRFFVECTASEHYASLFVGEYDEAAGTLRYANCGHVPPLLLRAGLRVERLAPTATVLGLFEPWRCDVVEIPFFEGDLLLAVSDGVTEVAGATGEPFGDRRLAAAALSRREERSAALVRAVADEVRAFAGGRAGDDLTILAARVRRPSAPARRDGTAAAGREER